MLTSDRRLRKSFEVSVGVAIQSGQRLLDPDGPDVSGSFQRAARFAVPEAGHA